MNIIDNNRIESIVGRLAIVNNRFIIAIEQVCSLLDSRNALLIESVVKIPPGKWSYNDILIKLIPHNLFVYLEYKFGLELLVDFLPDNEPLGIDACLPVTD